MYHECIGTFLLCLSAKHKVIQQERSYHIIGHHIKEKHAVFSFGYHHHTYGKKYSFEFWHYHFEYLHDGLPGKNVLEIK